MLGSALKRKLIGRLFTALDGLNLIDDRVRAASTCSIRGSALRGEIILDEGVVLYKCTLTGQIRVGRNSTLYGPNILLFSKHHPIQIGRYCSIAPGVIVQEYFHDPERMTTYFMNANVFKGDEVETVSKGPVTIGNDVWVGAHAVILSGVSIGNGAIVGAGSIVTEDVPDYAIVAGCPARIIRMRFGDEEIRRLDELRWWDWSPEKLSQNRDLFRGKLNLRK